MDKHFARFWLVQGFYDICRHGKDTFGYCVCTDWHWRGWISGQQRHGTEYTFTNLSPLKLPSLSIIELPRYTRGDLMFLYWFVCCRCCGLETFVHTLTSEQLFRLLQFFFVMTLTLNFQCQIWNLLYLSQKWFDCQETKSKHIDWTLGFKCDHRSWLRPWPWP